VPRAINNTRALLLVLEIESQNGDLRDPEIRRDLITRKFTPPPGTRVPFGSLSELERRGERERERERMIEL